MLLRDYRLIIGIFWAFGSVLFAQAPRAISALDHDLVPALLNHDASWQLAGEKDRIRVYRRDTTSGLFAFKVLATLNVSAPRMMAILRDVEDSKNWMPDLIKKEQVSEVSDFEAVTYTASHLKWPAKDRDYVMNNILSLDLTIPALVMKGYSVEHPKCPLHAEHVRASISAVVVIFRPVGMNQTEIIFYSLVDPNGWIPDVIVNYFQKRWAVSFLERLEKRAQQIEKPLRPGLAKMYQDLVSYMANHPVKDSLVPPQANSRIMKAPLTPKTTSAGKTIP